MNHLEIYWPITCSPEEMFDKISVNKGDRPAVLPRVLSDDNDKEPDDKCS